MSNADRDLDSREAMRHWYGPNSSKGKVLAPYMYKVAYSSFKRAQKTRVALNGGFRSILYLLDTDTPITAVLEKKEDKDRALGMYSDRKIPSIMASIEASGKLTESEMSALKEMWLIIGRYTNYEDFWKKWMEERIENEPIYTEFLSQIKGIGPVLAFGLFSYLGYWDRDEGELIAYAGLSVTNGKGMRLTSGKPAKFNTKLRALLYDIGMSMLKSKSQPYSDWYYAEKERELARTDENKPKNKLHAHYRALMRRVMKEFIKEYRIACMRILSQQGQMATYYPNLGKSTSNAPTGPASL